MRLAEVIGLPRDQRSSLFYALLLKDLGCSSNASRFAALFAADDHTLKASLTHTNWSKPLQSFRFVARSVAPGHFWLRRVWQALAVFSRGQEGARDVVLTRCERGAEIARMLGFADETVDAIRALDEHWDGRGQAYNLKGESIPFLGRILGLSQTVEVFFSSYGLQKAYEIAEGRSGTWFDPNLVNALRSIRNDSAFWHWLAKSDTSSGIGAFEPEDRVLLADENRLDLVAEAFALVIDAKSPWTYLHSNGVAELTVGIASRLGVRANDLRDLRRAALLHDVGKLGVSSLILDKPGTLTDDEFATIRRHPLHTYQILSRVGCFAHLADVASSHHERLDGRGYHRGRNHVELTRQARILCVADVCDALRQARPYRDGMSVDRVLDIMKRDVGIGLDPDCVSALEAVLTTAEPPVNAPPARLVPALAEDYQQAA